MPRPASPARCPILHLLAAWKADRELTGDLRAHLLSVVRQAWQESRWDGVMRRLTVAEILMLYRNAITMEMVSLVRARILSETVRALRSLGLLRLSGGGPRSFVGPAKRQIPKARVQTTGEAEARSRGGKKPRSPGETEVDDDEDDDGADDV